MTIEAPARPPMLERPPLLEKIVAGAIRFRWAVLTAVALLCAIGIWAFQRLPIDATPEITNVQVQINSEAAGFSPLDAIKIATLNGAKYLGRDATIGTIAAGKQADLIVVRGDPSSNISDVQNVETVFKRGIGYDSAKIFDSVKGRVGLH